jgi:hypothetical protein
LTAPPGSAYNAQGLILLCGFAFGFAVEVPDVPDSYEEDFLRSFSRFLGGARGGRFPARLVRDPRFRRRDQ